MPFLKNISLNLLLAVFFLSACSLKDNAPGDENIEQDMSEMSQDALIDDAPEDQKKALSEAANPDSTDMDRNYKYEGTYIYVSKSKMRLYVLNRNDSVLFSCAIACGMRKGNKQAREDYRTPEGHFRISGMFDSTDWIHRTKDGREVKGCYGPCFLRLATGRFSGIGIHGTNAPRSIGRRASEGCIRVNSQNIIALRDNYAYEGMPVIVSGELERLPDFAGLGKEERSAKALAQKTLPDSITPSDTIVSAPAKHTISSSKADEQSDTLVATETV